ncbi:hypothetical protein HMPREF9413_0764 [Paenibacillus sp. HGF7]|nr:hypothetical protein HMPREF9413_0764 [Paenibacillus sp. HGF7]
MEKDVRTGGGRTEKDGGERPSNGTAGLTPAAPHSAGQAGDRRQATPHLAGRCAERDVTGRRPPSARRCAAAPPLLDTSGWSSLAGLACRLALPMPQSLHVPLCPYCRAGRSARTVGRSERLTRIARRPVGMGDSVPAPCSLTRFCADISEYTDRKGIQNL